MKMDALSLLALVFHLLGVVANGATAVAGSLGSAAGEGAAGVDGLCQGNEDLKPTKLKTNFESKRK